MSRNEIATRPIRKGGADMPEMTYAEFEESRSRTETRARFAGLAGLFGVLATSVCCTLPLLLVLSGITGVWIGQLTSLYAYQPIFLTITAAFIAYGFYNVYWRPRLMCVEGRWCARPEVSRFIKISLWSAIVLLIIAVATPYVVALVSWNVVSK